MTIAIGARFVGGVIISADTKVVASDGATTRDSKVSLSVTRTKRMFAIADAAFDGYAAKMLAKEITSVVCNVKDENNLVTEIKTVMGDWYNSYKYQTPPSSQFILGCTFAGHDEGQLYFCEPPSTVLYCWEPIVIGQGARAVEPILSILSSQPKKILDVKSALLRLAYLMHVAKQQEGSACGGDTDTIVLSSKGAFTFVESKEMQEAETIAEEVHHALMASLGSILSTDSSSSFTEFSDTFQKISEKFEHFEFKSLKYLERIFWPQQKAKHNKD